MRILIAEDDDLSRLILQSTIEQFGHECITAADGSTAWELYQRTRVDVVISDCMMPGLDGVDFCRLVRADSRPGYTYFIVLTSLSDNSNMLLGIEAGADDYLAKPLDSDQLRVRLLVASRVTDLHHRLAEQAAELEQLNHRLFSQGRTDALTGVGNRLQLREDLDVISRQIAQPGHGPCAIMCDVDAFKMYNDAYGHAAGDKVLQVVAKTLVRTVRPGDVVYRYGGEEFLILLPDQPADVGETVAERVRRAVEALAIPHPVNPAGPVVTLSAGLAVLVGCAAQSVGAWLEAADAALYQAKRSGRNCVVVALAEDGAAKPSAGLQQDSVPISH